MWRGPTFQSLCIHTNVLYNLEDICASILDVSTHNSCIFFFFNYFSDFCLLPKQPVINRGGALWYFRRIYIWVLSLCGNWNSALTGEISDFILVQKALKWEPKVVYLRLFFCAGFPLCPGREMSCNISNAQNGVNIKWTLNVYSCMLWFPNDVDFLEKHILGTVRAQKHLKAIQGQMFRTFSAKTSWTDGVLTQMIAGYAWNCITTMNIIHLIFRINNYIQKSIYNYMITWSELEKPTSCVHCLRIYSGATLPWIANVSNI